VKRFFLTGCLGVIGLAGCYLLSLAAVPAYALAETARQLPAFAPGLWAWAGGADTHLSAATSSSLQIELAGYAGATSFACMAPAPVAALSSGYGPRSGAGMVAGGFHHGLDYSTCWCENYSVVTPMGGQVTYAGLHGVYGGLVVIENDGWQVLLAHLNGPSVTEGAVVEAGEAVGWSGNTGRFTTGPHIHMEFRDCTGADGCRSVDPHSAWLPGQTGACDWRGAGIGVSCSVYRQDPANRCPGMP
jgi:murein DD-endopeptidase MepM/ murein hydrolase activator NlpD